MTLSRKLQYQQPGRPGGPSVATGEPVAPPRGSGPDGGGPSGGRGPSVTLEAASAAAQSAASSPGGAGGFQSRAGGFLDRVARGAQYGAVRGQDYTGTMQRIIRHGDFSAVTVRGYQRSRPIDVQSLHDYVNRRPIESDPEALRRMAEARGIGPGGNRPYGPRAGVVRTTTMRASTATRATTRSSRWRTDSRRVARSPEPLRLLSPGPVGRALRPCGLALPLPARPVHSLHSVHSPVEVR